MMSLNQSVNKCIVLIPLLMISFHRPTTARIPSILQLRSRFHLVYNKTTNAAVILSKYSDKDYEQDSIESKSIITWWEDDDEHLNENVLTPKGKTNNNLFSPWRVLWNSPIQHQQESLLLQQQQLQEPHPLRTDIYEIYCSWRGLAKQQHRRTRRTRKGRRALWTSRLAFDDDSTTIGTSSFVQQNSDGMHPNNNNSNDYDDDNYSTNIIYDYTTFRLEFDPFGYVRLLSHSIRDDNNNQNGSRENNNSNNNKDYSGDCIGKWKLHPNGLTVHIPLPSYHSPSGEQQHVMEMDFHMNPFGIQPKLTRGIIYVPANHNNDEKRNPILKLLRLRTIVGTFTGKGIGVDTVDLSYQQRT